MHEADDYSGVNMDIFMDEYPTSYMVDGYYILTASENAAWIYGFRESIHEYAIKKETQAARTVILKKLFGYNLKAVVIGERLYYINKTVAFELKQRDGYNVNVSIPSGEILTWNPICKPTIYERGTKEYANIASACKYKSIKTEW